MAIDLTSISKSLIETEKAIKREQMKMAILLMDSEVLEYFKGNEKISELLGLDRWAVIDELQRRENTSDT